LLPGASATRPEKPIENVATQDTFMTAASPRVVWNFLENDYYANDEAYVFAVACAMRHEYQAIVDAGFRVAAQHARPGNGLESACLRR
jgi:hypothetical protein